MGKFITVYDIGNDPVVINLDCVVYYYRDGAKENIFEVRMSYGILYLPLAEMQKLAYALNAPMP